MPLLRPAASDYTDFVKGNALTLAQTGKVNKVAVAVTPVVAVKSSVVTVASKVSTTASATSVVSTKTFTTANTHK